MVSLAGWSVSAQESELVSSPYTNSVSAAGPSMNAVVSGDAGVVVYESLAGNLSAHDLQSGMVNLYWHDVANRTTLLISRNASGTSGGNGSSYHATISSNGQWVAFVSDASDLVDGDTNGRADIFLWDRETEQIRLVTGGLEDAGSQSGGVVVDNVPLSGNPKLTPDGAWVVFQSDATNLTDVVDINQISDVFAYEVSSGDMVLISADATGQNAIGGTLEDADLLPDGRLRVLFRSPAMDWLPGGNGLEEELFLRTLPELAWVWAGGLAPLSGVPQPKTLFDGRLGAHGGLLAFKVRGQTSSATDTACGLVIYDLDTTNLVFATDQFTQDAQVSWSDDEQRLAWENPGTGNIELMSRDGAVQGELTAPFAAACEGLFESAADADVLTCATLSGDGNRLAYVVGGGCEDAALVVADLRWTETGVEVVTNRLAASPVGSSFGSLVRPAFAVGGEAVVFESWNGALVEHDLNGAVDVFLGNVEEGSVRLVSTAHADRPWRTGNGLPKWWVGALSHDGSTVAYPSFDNVIAPGDTNTAEDLFVFHGATHSQKMITDVRLPGMLGENQLITLPGLSRDGRYMVYVVGAGGYLDGAGATGFYDKYLIWRDNLEQTDFLVGQIDTDPIYLGRSRQSRTTRPAISLDGQAVAFASYYDFFDQSQVYLWDRSDGTSSGPTLISRGAGSGGPSNGESLHPQFSPDGRWVVFESNADDLTGDSVANGAAHLYGYDRDNETMFLLSRPLVDAGGSARAENAVFSGNSRYLAYEAQPGGIVYRMDLAAPIANPFAHVAVCTNCASPRLTEDGSMIAYVDSMDGQIYVQDVSSGQRELVSRSGGEGAMGNGPSSEPWLSPDGRHVVFASEASNLVHGDSNGWEDVFLHDRQLGQTVVLSRSFAHGGTGNHRSFVPVMSGDGGTVVYQSFASDLIPGDYNLTADVFMVRLSGGEDTDGDGMADDWEVAYFDDLDRDGAGDFDGDGHTDLQEFQAGTNPKDDQSILRVLTLEMVSAGSGGVAEETVVVWASVPGKVYRVEYLDGLGGDWAVHPGEITATGEMASAGVPTGAGAGLEEGKQRYYRVRLVVAP